MYEQFKYDIVMWFEGMGMELVEVVFIEIFFYQMEKGVIIFFCYGDIIGEVVDVIVNFVNVFLSYVVGFVKLIV